MFFSDELYCLYDINGKFSNFVVATLGTDATISVGFLTQLFRSNAKLIYSVCVMIIDVQ